MTLGQLRIRRHEHILLQSAQRVKFLFVGLLPIFSYFFQRNSYFFKVLLGIRKHFKIFENNKIINYLFHLYEKLKNLCQKDQFEAYLNAFLLKLMPRLSPCFWQRARNHGKFIGMHLTYMYSCHFKVGTLLGVFREQN